MSTVRGECALCGQYVEMSCWREDGSDESNPGDAGNVWRLNVHGMFPRNVEPPCPGSMLTLRAVRKLKAMETP